VKAGQVVMALLEAGFAVRSASEHRIVAERRSPRVLLSVHPDKVRLVAKRWRVRASAPPGWPHLDVPVLRADTLIWVLQRAYGSAAPREVTP